jgi:hypothetical protein
MDSFPIFLIGRLIASAAEPKHKTTISSRDTAGSCQVVPHLSAMETSDGSRPRITDTVSSVLLPASYISTAA